MNKLSLSLTKQEVRWSLIYLLIYTFLLPSLLSYGNLLLPCPLPEATVNFLYFTINILCIILIGWRFLLASAKTALRSPFRCLRFAFIGLILYYLLNIVLAAFILWIRPDFSNVNDASIAILAEDNHLLLSIGTIILVPPVEEYLYRGLIFGQLYNRSKIAAYGISTVLFASIHVIGYIGHFDLGLLALCFLQYLPAGFCLGWAYAKADNIWAPILMHITINQIGMQAMR